VINRKHEKMTGPHCGKDLNNLPQSVSISDTTANGMRVIRSKDETTYFGPRHVMKIQGSGSYNVDSLRDVSYGRGLAGVVASSVYLGYDHNYIMNPKAVWLDTLWSRLCRPFGDDTILDDVIGAFAKKETLTSKYTAARMTVGDLQQNMSISLVENYRPVGIGLQCVFPYKKAIPSSVFNEETHLYLHSVHIDGRTVSKVYCEKSGANVTTVEGTDTAFLSWETRTGKYTRTVATLGAVINIATGDIVDMGLTPYKSSRAAWQELAIERAIEGTESVSVQDASPESIHKAIAKEDVIYSGYNPSEDEMPISIVEESVAQGAILMLSSYGLRNVPGEDPTNILGWELSSEIRRAVQLAKDAKESKKYAEFTRSPRSHVRAMLKTKESIGDSLGISL